MTTHNEFYFRAKSESAESVSALLADSYDFALLGVSWDSRCLAICGAPKIRLSSVILLEPGVEDDLGLRVKHGQILNDFLKERSEDITLLVEDAREPEATWERLYDIIVRSSSISFPVESALVELSTSRRFYSLGVISMLLRLGLAKKVSILYSECSYEQTGETFEFTDGTWEKRLIPFLDGNVNPAAPDFWLVNCGFEGVKTRRFIRRDEPERIQVLLADPGFTKEYAAYAAAESDFLVREFGLIEDDIIKAPAGDAIEVWKKLSTLSVKHEGCQVSYICGGPKPHSLGMALHAVANRYPAVYYIKPDSYKVVKTAVTGTYWLYEVADLSQIPL
jgi:hypothetical protein